MVLLPEGSALYAYAIYFARRPLLVLSWVAGTGGRCDVRCADTKQVLHTVNGKPYWEMFASAFTSANAVLERRRWTRTRPHSASSQNWPAKCWSAGRPVVADGGIEGEAEEVFLARAAQFCPWRNSPKLPALVKITIPASAGQIAIAGRGDAR